MFDDGLMPLHSNPTPQANVWAPSPARRCPVQAVPRRTLPCMETARRIAPDFAWKPLHQVRSSLLGAEAVMLQVNFGLT